MVFPSYGNYRLPTYIPARSWGRSCLLCRSAAKNVSIDRQNISSADYETTERRSASCTGCRLISLAWTYGSRCCELGCFAPELTERGPNVSAFAERRISAAVSLELRGLLFVLESLIAFGITLQPQPKSVRLCLLFFGFPQCEKLRNN